MLWHWMWYKLDVSIDDWAASWDIMVACHSVLMCIPCMQLDMALRIVVGCSMRSGCDKVISFYRISKVILNTREEGKDLSKRRRAGFLWGISRGNHRDKIDRMRKSSQNIWKASCSGRRIELQLIVNLQPWPYDNNCRKRESKSSRK